MKVLSSAGLLWIIVSSLIFLYPLPAHSQTDSSAYFNPAQNFHQWGAVTLFSGLPSDNVRAIAQTADGILWFGTDNGLAKFDGRRILPTSLGVETGKILALQATSGNKLWIGTDAGAFFFDGKIFRLVSGTEGFPVTSVLEAQDRIWLATNQGNIFSVTQSENDSSYVAVKIPSGKLQNSKGSPLEITSLAQLGGLIIAGTRSRSFIGVDANRTTEFFSRPRPFFVNALARDKSGAIWLGADDQANGSGLYLVRDAARPERVGSNIGNVSALAPDERGVWIGTAKNGLFYYADGRETAHYTFQNTAGGLRSNSVNAVFVDRENVVWIGTGRGVCRFDGSGPSNSVISDKSNSNFVRTLLRTRDGRVLAGTNRGLFVRSENNWLESPDFSGKTIYSIAEDTNGEILIATPNGLYKEKDSLTAVVSGDVRGSVDFQGTTYAAVFGRGIVNTETQATVLTTDSPTAVFAGAERLFVGTATGEIYIFDGKSFEKQAAFTVLDGAAVWKIYEAANGELWLAGANGLFLFRAGSLQKILTEQDVRDVAVNGQEVWAATVKNGVYHLREDENFGWLVSNLNVEQGLPSEQTFALHLIEDNLLIGTNRGTSLYQPNRNPPQIILTRALSQRLHAADEIENTIALDYPQNSLLIEVAGLSSRTFPEQFQYAFTLKNMQGEVLDEKLSTDAQFAPTNLKAGEYIIEARVFSKDLLASSPMIVKFSVARAPFPRTAVALGVLLALAVAGLIWAIIEHRRIADKNRQLAAARFDLANEAERERRRIARDLHDQTLADLRELMIKSDKLTSDSTGNFRREIESVSTEIRRICEDLSPSVLENVGLAAALEFLLGHSNAAAEHGFSADPDIDEVANFSPNAQMQIYRIAQEVLNNIKRHSDAKMVNLAITVSAEKDYVLQISNDGKFFNPAETEQTNIRGRGINNIRARAALIKAEIGWQNSDAGENIFQLKKKI